MQLQNYYYWYKDAIPKHLCDDIVRYGKQLQDQMAVTGGFGDVKNLNKKQTKDLTIPAESNNAIDRFKQGFLVDNFVYLSKCSDKLENQMYKLDNDNIKVFSDTN